MAYPTPIEWTDATWNPVGGCSIHSPGCTHCYAQGLAGSPRLRSRPLYKGVVDETKAGPVFNGKLTQLADDHSGWSWPCRWRGAADRLLGPMGGSTIFVGDMSDLFHEARPFAVIDRVVAAIVYSRHIGQFLTKRPEIMCAYFTELKATGRWREFPHPILGKPNFAADAEYDEAFARCWAMTSCENQPAADVRVPWLLRTPLPIHGVSAEPLLGPIDFFVAGMKINGKLDIASGERRFIDLIITGGESGKRARPMHPDWARSIRDQCATAGTAFFFKQWGEFASVSEVEGEGDHFRFPDGATVRRVGKKRAGRRLDGREHNAMPLVGETRPSGARRAA